MGHSLEFWPVLGPLRSFPRKRESRAKSEERTGSPLSRGRAVIAGIAPRRPPPQALTRRNRGPYVSPAPDAQVAELVDALVSGTSGESRGGSSPLLGTNNNN